MPPDAPSTLVGFLLLAAGLCLLAGLWFSHLATRRVTGHTARGHLLVTWPHHLLAVVALLVGAVLVGAGATVVVTHHGGAVLRTLHIRPAHRPPRAGGVGGAYTSPDLFAAGHMVLYVNDQGTTNSCCGQAITEIDTLGRALRYGEHPPAGMAPLSGFKPWWYASGQQNVGTTVEDERDALNAHGQEALRYWPPGGYETPADAARSYLGPGAATAYDYYLDGGGGAAGLADVEWRLDRLQPVGLVWAVHASSDRPPPDGWTDDSGAFLFYHCVVAVRYSTNYAGHGPAVEIWNSWGTGWGEGGFGWLSARAFGANVLGAWTETPGARIAAWEPPPAPVPTATARPTPRATATPRPRPRPTAVPCGARAAHLVHATNVRAGPRGSAAVVRGAAPGQALTLLCQQTPHWTLVRLAAAAGRWADGWVYRTFVGR